MRRAVLPCLFHCEEGRYRLAGRDVPTGGDGAIVAVIGLELAGVAANMAGLLPADGQSPDSKTIIISLVTLGVTVFGSVLFRGFMAIIPILIGVLAGYALSFVMGVVDTTPIAQAHWFALPTFYTPRFEWFAIFTILPAALVVIAEHVGHLVVTANIVKRDLIRDPGLHRSMFANGFSTIISGFFGSTPNTTYGENIGVMAITRVYSTGLSAARQSSQSCSPAWVNWRQRSRSSRFR